MDMTPDKTSGWRGTPDLWLAAAYAALLEGGVAAVRLGALAARMGLSRTSFYGHFASREALLAALAARWEVQNTGNLLARAEAPARTLPEALLNLFDCWLDSALFDARFDMAVRAWGLADPAMKPRVAAADAARIAAVARLFARFGFGAEEADVRACTLYYTQIGYFALGVAETPAHRAERMPHYIKTFAGQGPSTAEMAAFRARHGL